MSNIDHSVIAALFLAIALGIGGLILLWNRLLQPWFVAHLLPPAHDRGRFLAELPLSLCAIAYGAFEGFILIGIFGALFALPATPDLAAFFGNAFGAILTSLPALAGMVLAMLWSNHHRWLPTLYRRSDAQSV